MSKLFNSREWLTIDEAAKYLSRELGESVCSKDVYRLILDGHLRVSVNLVNNTDAAGGELVGREEIIWDEVPANPIGDYHGEYMEDVIEEPIVWMRSEQIEEDLFFNELGKVEPIKGVYDLLMFESEKRIFEQLFQNSVGGATVKVSDIKGSLVKKDDMVYRLMESFIPIKDQLDFDAQQKKQNLSMSYAGFTPEEMKELCPDAVVTDNGWYKYEVKQETPREDGYRIGNKLQFDSIFVIKTSSIMDYLKPPKEEVKSWIDEELSTKERESMLVILAALCNEAKIDLSKKAMAPVINKMAQNIGVSITDDTIRKVIKQINMAVAARSK